MVLRGGDELDFEAFLRAKEDGNAGKRFHPLEII